MEIKINSLVSLNVEQIKISGTLSIAGKTLPAGVNKTLDAGIISELPSELIQQLTQSTFGGDYSYEDYMNIYQTLSSIPMEEETVDIETETLSSNE